MKILLFIFLSPIAGLLALVFCYVAVGVLHVVKMRMTDPDYLLNSQETIEIFKQFDRDWGKIASVAGITILWGLYFLL